MTIDELIARAKEASKNQCMSDLCRENFKQLAEWLEELKQYREQYKEQNQETNLDHFQQEILEKGLWNLAVVKGRPERCDHIKCIDCELSKDRSRGCHEKVMDWLKQPRKAPANKLTRFEYDLLQSFLKGHPFRYQFKNINALTEMKEKGYFKGVDMDATLEDILADCEITEEE
jgi:hypothetical protein|nr:MAG TPA: hypothetical protein [Caudoviricetes sp.]